MMSRATLFARLASRAAQLPACVLSTPLPVTSLYICKQNFISVIMYDDNDRASEKEEKEEMEDAEFDVAEFGSDPYPYYRKVRITFPSVYCILDTFGTKVLKICPS